jgi:UDP-2,3-diacylglucosamine pyrophosphatase LpxH
MKIRDWIASTWEAYTRWIANLVERGQTFRALDAAHENAYVVKDFDPQQHRYVIVSDTHKAGGAGNDDFEHNEKLYCYALQYYLREGYRLILNGDIEELWETNYPLIRQRYQQTAFEAERQYIERGEGFYLRIYGNHDDFWKRPKNVETYLAQDFGPIKAYEAVRLGDRVFVVHGHQGDPLDDPARFREAAFFVRVWGRMQQVWGWVKGWLHFSFKRPRPMNYRRVRETRDRFLYEWARQHHLLLIAGHTHKAMFLSSTHTGLQQRALNYVKAKKAAFDAALGEPEAAVAQYLEFAIDASDAHPTLDDSGTIPCYFNSGCCLYDHGITAIELAARQIRLIKWEIVDSYLEAENPPCGEPSAQPHIVRAILQCDELDHVLSRIAADG